MYAAVQMHYRRGVYTPPDTQPLIGQIMSGRHKSGVEVLRLWPVDWVVNSDPEDVKPLGTLWHPELGVVGHMTISFQGLEPVQQGGQRAWVVQRWECHVLHGRAEAVERMKPDPRWGEVRPSVPVPPLDPNDPDPFGS